MVVVNPDSIKDLMPEFNTYPVHGQHNGNMCHKESGFIQEIAVKYALRRRTHLVEDGSLRDADWYTGKGARTSEDPSSDDWIGVIPGLRKRHPHYRIAVLHVTVQSAHVLTEEQTRKILEERLSERAARTGRET